MIRAQLPTMYFVLTILLVTIFDLSSCNQPHVQLIDKDFEKARFEHPCAGSGDCKFKNSECSGERCGCIGGFEWSLYHEEDTCVPGSVYLTTDYHLNSLYWTDNLMDKQSMEYKALLNRLEKEMRKNSGDLFIDLPGAYFHPSQDNKVVANLWYHLKNPMTIKKDRTKDVRKRSTIELDRNRRDVSAYVQRLKSRIMAAAQAAGKKVTIVITVNNGPLGKYCETSCAIAHSECLSNTCRCLPGYVHLTGDDNTCHPLVPLEGDCNVNEECGDNAECKGNKCVCKAAAVEITQGTECGLRENLDGDCTDDAQCQTPGAGCYGTCVCVSGERDGNSCSGVPPTTTTPEATTTPQATTTTPACGSVIGAKCDVECPCTYSNTFCSNSSCECLSTYIDVNGTCLSRSNIGGSCEDDLQCPDLSYCSITTCVCSSSTVLVTGVGCLPLAKLGRDCTNDAQCTVNAGCNTTTFTCACFPEFAQSYNVNHTANNTCVPIEVSLHATFDFLPWDPNMSDTSSAAYATQLTALETLLLSIDSNFLRIENLVITEGAGGEANNDFDIYSINEDTIVNRVRREAIQRLESLGSRLIKAARNLNQPLRNLVIRES